MGLDRVAPVQSEHTITVRHTNHDEEAVEHLRVMKRLGVVHDKLIEMFGYSGLSRYQALLEAADGKAVPKLIEAAAVEITPTYKR